MAAFGALSVALLLWVEPTLANKFETIGGGVAGPTGLKREWLQRILFITAATGAIGAVLAVVYPRKNPLFLNFGNWKKSAAVMAVFSAVSLIAAVLI